MCLIVFAWQRHPDYPLVVAANRDEYLARPAVPAHWWTDAPELLAGRDLEAGGTWMGLSRGGRFAALTNYRDPSRHIEGAPSRGALVRNALEAGDDAETTLKHLATGSAAYAAFNLLVGDGRSLGVLESTTGAVRMLEAGIYGLSNHLLDTPWPKLLKARERLAALLPNLPDDDAALALLRDDTPAPDLHLPDTGVSVEWERWLSSPFIRAPGYGTRCSSLLTVDREGNTRLREWTWDERGEPHGDVTHRFAAQPPPARPSSPAPEAGMPDRRPA
ncbi:NRDE family protein [Thauera linaloolentis]|uniref:NRDE family protein n=1 Tax=Thauera linaloolentis (strain DSM 12138 / JCM 21573 / CCUG 41526 / CIP 105981 / IAM 15112 / NBRC 102519 / 47Lol) TaxID=1123367 RepID=N6Z4S0_THAL4|nr:NRDE family protein [Thauera linaloolentis]ENO89577.1 hypothetical protein C666_05310 [Thauera linaloolentis 47Lol = DSM 12138]MCM8565895.1 NRDE family protein [Thauera linaloolentis]